MYFLILIKQMLKVLECQYVTLNTLFDAICSRKTYVSVTRGVYDYLQKDLFHCSLSYIKILEIINMVLSILFG